MIYFIKLWFAIGLIGFIIAELVSFYKSVTTFSTIAPLRIRILAVLEAHAGTFRELWWIPPLLIASGPFMAWKAAEDMIYLHSTKGKKNEPSNKN